MAEILVTGGAGYIGSACVGELLDRGHSVVVLDNLSTGHRECVDRRAVFYEGEVGDKILVKQILDKHAIEAVFHFAAFIQVGESVKSPAKYFANNYVQTLTLLDVLKDSNCKKIIFSSTAAVFGNPIEIPIDEDHPKNPINPYGLAKLMVENTLSWYGTAYGLKYCIFRYFNAAGATKHSMENHVNESHLIPLVFDAALGKRDSITIMGSDYDTPDGTCIRDYIHIADLVEAHILALQYLTDHESNNFNLGNGNGYSVKEVIDMVEKITGKKVPVTMGERRGGDADKLVASSQKARDMLGWQPKYADLESIVTSAWTRLKDTLL